MRYILYSTLPTIVTLVMMMLATEPGMPQCGINTAVLVSMVAIGLDATLPIDHGWFYGKPNAKGISQAKWFVPVVLFTKVIFGVTTLLLITWESKLPSVPGSLLGMLPDGSWTAIFLIAYANLSANMLFTLYMKDHDRARAVICAKDITERNEE